MRRRTRAERLRLALAALLGGLVVAFALLNTAEVEVDWIFGTFNTPLIVVIIVSLLAGVLLGLAPTLRGRPRRPHPKSKHAP